MPSPIEIFVAILRVMAASVMFTLVLIGAVTFWRRRDNLVIKYGGVALAIMATRNLLISLILVYYALLGETSLMLSNLISIAEHIAITVALLHLLGYLPDAPDLNLPPETP